MSAEYFVNIPSDFDDSKLQDMDKMVLSLSRELETYVQPIVLSNPLALIDLKSKVLLTVNATDILEYTNWYNNIISLIILHESSASKLFSVISRTMQVLFASTAAKNYVYNQRDKGGLKTHRLRMMINTPEQITQAVSDLQTPKEDTNGL